VWEGRPWFEYPLSPGSPGHEGWGVVDAVGDRVTQVSAGDRVALLSYHAFATHDVAEANQVVRLPTSLDDLPFPGEAVGCAINVFQRSNIRADDTVAVVGVGFLGALLIQLAAAEGARVVAISRREFGREVAHRCGAEIVLVVPSSETAKSVSAITGGDGCDCVFEATGFQEPLNLASSLVRTRGRLVIAGYHQDGPRTVDMQSWNWRGLDVINAHERDPQTYVRGMEKAVREVASGRLRVSELLTHQYPLNDLNAALKTASERPDGYVKGWIRCFPEV
jgi:threonine dehydrogenase-like Zn-dependent dehydrogenase